MVLGWQFWHFMPVESERIPCGGWRAVLGNDPTLVELGWCTRLVVRKINRNRNEPDRHQQ
jgi:hypothetical protein